MSLLLWALLIWIAPALMAALGLLWFAVIAPRLEKGSSRSKPIESSRGRH